MATLPVSPARVERVLTAFEAKLNRAEAKALRILVMGLLASQDRLLAQLGPQYVVALGASQLAARALKEARARQLLEQVRAVLNVIPPNAEPALLNLIEDAATLGRESAGALITLHDPGLARSFSQLPREALLAAASNSHARLIQHGEVAAQKMSQHIVAGIASGTSWRKVATEIKNEVGITRRQAETIVRTESLSAHTQGHLEAYRAAGITWLTWNATQDERVCEHCASRAGSSWEAGEAPQPPAHPNCRCRLTPDKPEWHRAGLVDEAGAREHNRAAMAQAGITRRTFAATDFEKRTGATFDPPAWTP